MRMLMPMIVIGTIAALACLALGAWLIAQSAWWWILEAAFIVGTTIFLLLAAVATFAIRRFAPQQTPEQRKAVRAYADKLQRVAENLGISKFMLLFRIVRDIIWPREQTFIKMIANDSSSLHTDFIALQRLFDKEES